MNELASFTWAWMGLGAATLVLLLFISAPYGRHARTGWGPTMSARLGWVLMETPAALVVPLGFVLGGGWRDPSLVVFVGMWCTHYFYRAWIQPMKTPPGGRNPLVVVMLAVIFNLVNGGLNGMMILAAGPGLHASFSAEGLVPYGEAWLADPRFVVGVALFLGGMALNRASDRTLLALKAEGKGYQVPRGGGFRWVSCPNYLGEILEWCGWAVATWSLAGLAFAVWTVANLVPRARTHHLWYRETFPDYPSDRKALIPGLF